MEVIDLTGEDSPQVQSRSRRSRGRNVGEEVMGLQSQLDDVQFVKETPGYRTGSGISRVIRRGSSSRHSVSAVPVVGESSNNNNIISSVPVAQQPANNSFPEENPLICPICYDKFDQPSTTPCGHIFCTKCLMDCLSRNPTCPKCRTKVQKKKVLRVYFG